MAFPLADSTNPDEMAAKIAALEGNVATMQAQMGGFLQPDNRFHFDHLSARSVEFDFGPMGVANLQAPSQSIPNDVNTAINWSVTPSNHFFRSPEPITYSTATSSEIRVVGLTPDHLYLAWGHVHFSSNSSGRRAVSFTRHFGGSSQSGDTPVSIDAASGTQITGATFAVRWIGGVSSATGDSEAYLTIDVLQNSGAALNITYASVTIVRIY